MSVHGTARFATREELQKAGYLRGRKPGQFPDGLMVGWWLEDEYDFEPIEYAGDLHQLIVAGTGGGKFTTALAPMLLGSSMQDQTIVVVDPKGEIAQLAGPFFEKPFGSKQTVHLLDPWDLCGTGQTASLNVLDDLAPKNPNYVDDARALADAMIISSGSENTHWDNTARNFLAAMLLYVANSPKETKRDLVRVREIVTMTWQLPKAYPGKPRATLSELIIDLVDSDIGGGAVKRGASALLNREDKERSGIISSIDRDTAWIDSPQMEKVLRGTSLDLKQAARGGQKYFVVLPPEFFLTHRAWLRLMVTAFAKAFKRTVPDTRGGAHTRWRHIVIDEFANLGEMNFMLNDVAVSRGYAIKYHLAIQDFSQLARVYDKGWESFVNNSFQRFFAVGDLFTADYVSRMLGAATVEAESRSYGTSGGFSINQGYNSSDSTGETSSIRGMGGSRSSGSSSGYSSGVSQNEGWSNSRSFSQTQRSLHTPDEVRRLGQDAEYVFFRGMHPVLCWRPPYWEIFPSLPDFSLREIAGTIGRAPRDRTELRRYLAWQDRPRLMVPAVMPPAAPKPELEEVQPYHHLPIEKTRLSLGTWMTLGVLAAAVLWAGWWIHAQMYPPIRHVVEAAMPPPPSTKIGADGCTDDQRGSYSYGSMVVPACNQSLVGGKTLSDYKTPVYTLCLQACIGKPQCSAFSFDGQRCLHFSGAPSLKAAQGWVSALMVK